MHRYLSAILLSAFLSGCASNRVLILENRALKQDLNESSKKIAAFEHTTRPTFDSLVTHLDSLGLSFETHPQGPFATAACPETNIPFSAQVWEDSGLFYVATTEFVDLYDTHSTAGAFAAMAQVATINYDLPLAKLSVNERSGQIILSVQCPADDGLTRTLVHRAVIELCTSAARVKPVLQKAALGDGL